MVKNHYQPMARQCPPQADTSAVRAYMRRLQLFHDSAGKFCLDKWTRQREEGRVEGKAHEEVLHAVVKEDQDVAACPTARTHSRPDQPHRSRQFSQRNAGDAPARCPWPDL